MKSNNLVVWLQQVLLPSLKTLAEILTSTLKSWDGESESIIKQLDIKMQSLEDPRIVDEDLLIGIKDYLELVKKLAINVPNSMNKQILCLWNKESDKKYTNLIHALEDVRNQRREGTPINVMRIQDVRQEVENALIRACLTAKIPVTTTAYAHFSKDATNGINRLAAAANDLTNTVKDSLRPLIKVDGKRAKRFFYFAIIFCIGLAVLIQNRLRNSAVGLLESAYVAYESVGAEMPEKMYRRIYRLYSAGDKDGAARVVDSLKVEIQHKSNVKGKKD